MRWALSQSITSLCMAGTSDEVLMIKGFRDVLSNEQMVEVGFAPTEHPHALPRLLFTVVNAPAAKLVAGGLSRILCSITWLM